MNRMTGEGTIVFVVPKSRKAPSGFYDLSVENTVGSDTSAGFAVLSEQPPVD